MKKLFIVICFALCTLNFSLAQDTESRMQWFKDAKLSIFIPCEDTYQLKGFNAENYNPDAWAGLFRESGARYAVLTMNDSWGYQPDDENYKPVNLIIRIFADVIGMGGNLLLDIGPKADGSIPDEQLQILQELGTWTTKHSEAIYGTLAGIPKDCYYGPSTLSADSTILYLFVATSPSNTPSRFSDVLLKGIINNINAMWALGNGAKPEQKTWLKPWWSGNPGLITIEIPMEAIDAQMTVIAVQLDGKIALKF